VKQLPKDATDARWTNLTIQQERNSWLVREFLLLVFSDWFQQVEYQSASSCSFSRQRQAISLRHCSLVIPGDGTLPKHLFRWTREAENWMTIKHDRHCMTITGVVKEHLLSLSLFVSATFITKNRLVFCPVNLVWVIHVVCFRWVQEYIMRGFTWGVSS